MWTCVGTGERENETKLMFRFDVLPSILEWWVALGPKIVNRPENMFREQLENSSFPAIAATALNNKCEELRRTETASSLTLLNGKRIKATENHFNGTVV